MLNVSITNREETINLDIENSDLLDALTLVERGGAGRRNYVHSTDGWGYIEVNGKKAYRTPWGTLAIITRKKRGTREYLIEAFPQIIASWLTGNTSITYYKGFSSFVHRWVDSEGETVTHKNAVI